MLVCWTLLACVWMIVWRDKEPVPEEDPAELNDPATGVEDPNEDEGKSHWPFDHTDPMNDCLW